VHWFNTEAFFTNALRMLRPGGLLAAWGYGIGTIKNDKMDDLLQNVKNEFSFANK
jgi:hypothetical protein